MKGGGHGHHLSTLALDSLRLGGLPAAQAQQAQAHLGHCPLCARRLREADDSAEHFLRVVHPRTLQLLRQRMHAPPLHLE